MTPQVDVRTKYTEIFPGKKIAFVVKNLSMFSPTNGLKYTQCHLPGGSWTAITETDKFLSLELLAEESVDPPRLAGSVEIILGASSLSTTHPEFSATNGSLVIKPRVVANIQTSDGSYTVHSTLAASLFHLKLSDAGEEPTLEIKFTLHAPGEITEKAEVDLPDSLETNQYVSELNTRIMRDESTADLKISCGKKNNKKIFYVHKSFFCARSPVFRAAVETDMIEGRTKEIFIEEVDPATLLEMTNYVYTGAFTGKDLNVQMVAWLADKYDLPGMMDLLCFRMNEDVEDENIADMLIAADRHDSDQLKSIAMNKLRKKREILINPAFRGKLQNYQNILFELIQEL